MTSTTVQPEGPLVFTMSVSPDPAGAGTLLVYTITVSNRGTESLGGVTLRMISPNYVSFNETYTIPESVECVGPFCEAGEPMTWTVGTLAAGKSRTLQIPAVVISGNSSPPEGTVVQTEAMVLTESGLVVWASDSFVVNNNRVFTLAMTEDSDPATPGAELTYTLTYGNRGSTSAPGTVLTAPLPEGTSFVSASNGGTVEGDSVKWVLGTVSAGESRRRLLTVRLDAGLAQGSLVVGEAEIHDSNDPQNNARAHAATTVQAENPLALTMEVNPNPVASGTQVSYLFTAVNQSGQSLSGVELHMISPDYLSFSDGGGISCPGSTCDAGEPLTWSLNTLGAGESSELMISATVPSSAPDGTLIVSPALLIHSASGSVAQQTVTVRVGDAMPEEAPGAPQLSQPGDDSAGVSTSPTFTWQPVGNADFYTLQVATSNSFEAASLVVNQTGIITTSRQITALDENTTYFWRVQAVNDGGESPWSAVRNFTTQINAPTQAPPLSSPANGALDVSTPATLRWAAAARATRYDVHVATDSTFSNLALDLTGITETTVQPSGLGNSTTYFWRVRGVNDGGKGPWSAVWRFTTAEAPPPAPTLIAPLDGATGVSTSLTLMWSAAERAERYEVRVATDEAFQNLVTIQTELTATSIDLSGLAKGTTFYWQVKGVNSRGEGTWSATWRFETIREAPGPVTLIAPEDNASDVPVDTLLVWTAAARASSYQVQVSKDAAFEMLILDETGVTGTSQALEGLDHLQQYYWRVKALNSGGESDWSAAWSFETVLAAPGSVMLIAPEQDAAGEPTTVALVWEAVDRAATYHVQVATSIDFRTPVVDARDVATTSYTVNGLQDNRLYFWHVRAINAGGEGPFSQVRSFLTYPLTITHNANLSFDDPSKNGNYLLIGLPGQDDMPVEETFSGKDGKDHDWRVFFDTGDAGSTWEDYLIEFDGSDRFTFRPGQGFWASSRDPWSVQTQVNTVLLQAGKVFKIKVHNGWNIITNPFKRDISWACVDEANGGVLRSLYRYNKGYEESAALEAYEGFYFNNARNLDSLIIPYAPVDVTGQQCEGEAALPLLHLRASAQDGAEANVFVGIASAASPEFDAYDRVAPPGAFQRVRLVLTHEERPARYRRLRRDVRAEIGIGQAYDLVLDAPYGQPITLNVTGLEHFPKDEVYLEDRSRSTFYNLQAQPLLTLQPPGERGRYRLLIGPPAFIEQEQADSVPEALGILAAYPNPFKNATVIEYALPEAVRVRLVVYDVLGRQVQVLVDGPQQPGRHQVR